MQHKLSLKLQPHEAASATIIQQFISAALSINPKNISGFYKVKESIDARSRQQIWINLTLVAFINEPYLQRPVQQLKKVDVSIANKTCLIVGAGPAGLFAALQLIELGIKPIIIDRGKNVRDRRRDLATLNKQGIVNPESNYCFGEGGAGTYSDGKLYTRSSKRGSIDRILNAFVQFGADEQILYQAHPHIGTNKLPHIITAIRNYIIDCGGQVLFEKKLTNFVIKNNSIAAVEVNHNEQICANAYLLATGHSANDIFELLHSNKILIEAKPFALGVRIEHPQQIIDACQYHLHTNTNGSLDRGVLPPASYSLVEQVEGKGVFSFCMCPGGIIAPAATQPNELVVNGWSPSKRNNPYANSGMVVSVDVADALKELKISDKELYHSKQLHHSPLSLLYFQQMIERRAYKVGGGNFVAPAQRVVDFCEGKFSNNLPACSYLPGIKSASMYDVLPQFVHSRLQAGIKAFGKRMKGYYTNDAVVVATESRTSSPVRIPRDAKTLQHPQIKNLFPCGEGAGYAGGIVSAAMDGERVAQAIAEQIL